MKSPVAPLKPLFDERAKHPVLLVEAIEKSANVTLFAKHAISYVDGTFIALHDGPPREWISAPTRAAHSMNVNPTWPRNMKSSPDFAAKFGLSLARHDPGSAACASSSASFATSVHPGTASTKRRDNAASPRTNLTRLSG
jgi:hypothetical protein